jgi:type III pantothenate kinase
VLAVLDIGNSNVVFGLYQDKALVHRFTISTRHEATVDEYGIMLVQLLEQKSVPISQISAAAVASVVPQLNATFEDVCRCYLNVPALMLGRDLHVDMPILVENPQEVGADRIVNAYSGYEKYHHAVIVVDLGTATSFDVVNAQGKYLGGAIAPGAKSINNGLSRSVSQVPYTEIRQPRLAIGKNTKEAVCSGVFFGYVGLIDSIVMRIKRELGCPARVVATGGLANLFKGASLTIEEVDTNLTLSGLHLIYLKNYQ